MRVRSLLLLALGLLFPLAVDVQAAEPTAQPIPRKDAFFGMHFDLHPGKTDTALGADLSEENVAALLERVKPDYVQYDCKGHPGYTGYPTKVGWPSPGIVQDSLALWRKVTRAHGVGLYIHYSGVYDQVAIEHHPEWARITPDGKPDPHNTSTFGPYVDQLLIPQLIEVATAYDLDGAWLDGECWAAALDYSPAAIEAWQKETGFSEVPKSRKDPHWLEWKMFQRRQFEKYLIHWVDAIHAARPGIQLTSNWMYTTFAPKPVVAKLDFLSGDYSPTLSVDRARVEARYLASTAMPWDLMAWGFNQVHNLGFSLKPALQLQQEAAVVLMQGGGFQVYYQPTRSGYIIPEIIDTMGSMADFCRARQKVSHKSTSVPQVALLFSTETQMDRSDAVFQVAGVEELEGVLHALLEEHYSVDVLAEHQLQPRLKEFPLVVVPNSYKLSDEFRQALRRYVEEGGRLLLVGPQAARLFEADLGVRLEGEPQQLTTELATAAGVVNENGLWQKVTPTTAEPIGRHHPTRDTRQGGEVAASCATLGQGQIAAIYGPLALNYFKSHHPSLRRFLGDLVARLFPTPAVRVEGPPCLDVALRRTTDGLLSVHLLNTAGMPVGGTRTMTDFIPPVGPVGLKLQVAEKPQQVVWAPGDSPLEWSWDQGTLSVTVPQVEIHGVVVVKP